MSIRRLAIYVGINIVVSASVTLLVLNLWAAGRAPTRLLPTVAPQALAPTNPSPTTRAASTPTAIAAQFYTVRAGDTLVSIASTYGVSVDDLLAANQLTPDSILSIGQKLAVPSTNSLSTRTPLPPLPTSTPRALPKTPSSPAQDYVTIKEIVSGGTLADEAVVLTNLSGKVDLTGWTLSDGEGHKYVFPDLTLLPDAEVKVHTTSGANSAIDLYWGQSQAVWGARGTIAYLYDATGNLIATYRVP